jgi:hypothetical protein
MNEREREHFLGDMMGIFKANFIKVRPFNLFANKKDV